MGSGAASSAAAKRLHLPTAPQLYIRLNIYEDCSMAETAKIFKSGNSQAVRLPKAFRFAVDEVEISREGDAVVLRPKNDTGDRWKNLRSAVRRGVSADFLAGGPEQSPDQMRPALDDLFR
jgi:antitoxin VapB